MLRSLLCVSLLLTLPCAARADQYGATPAFRPASLPAIQPIDAAPVLDLSFEPPAPAEQDSQAVTPHAASVPAAQDAEAPFSLGVKIKTRREAGGPPREPAADPDDPLTLTDKVGDIVERSSIGLTGTYRF